MILLYIYICYIISVCIYIYLNIYNWEVSHMYIWNTTLIMIIYDYYPLSGIRIQVPWKAGEYSTPFIEM